jgi:adenosine kinase
MKQKTGLDEDGILQRAGALIVTRGEHGCTVRQGTISVSVPAVTPRAIVDPTGVGDAFRGGLLKGLATGASLEVSCRLGSVAAAYALEHLGGQSHAYTWEEFTARYESHFGPM